MKSIIFLIISILSTSTIANSFFHPKWSFNGKQIAFYGYVGKTPDIFIVNVENAQVTKLTNTIDHWEIEPQWVDSSTLAFLSGSHMGSMSMSSIDINSGSTKSMTCYQGYETFVSNVPNTEEMIVNRKKNRKELSNLYRLGKLGSAPSQLNQQQGIVVYQIIWEESIMLATYEGDIVSLDLNGKITAHLTKSDFKESFPNLSKDKSKLVYVSDEKSKSDIYIKDLSTGKITRLTHDDYSEYSPAFSFDSSYIIFSGVEDGSYNILSMDLAGNRLKNFTAHLHN